MDLELRPWTPDEQDVVVAAVERAFLSDVDPSAPEPLDVVEPERTLSAWDDGRPVATAAAFSLQMAVPGGVRPVAGVTLVSVQATHRRQGLLRRMMQHQLDGLHATGEAVAALWASEPAIYGRFGYGAASRSLGVRLQRGDVLRPGAPAAGTVSDLPAADAREQLDTVWARAYPQRPGEYARPAPWWDHVLHDPPSRRGGKTALRCALLDDGSGYALYAAKGGWDERGPAGSVTVRELAAVDGRARLRLWSYLLGLDLATTWQADRLPLDDALLGAVADGRRLTAKVQDGLYVRLVRVGEALAQRTYGSDVDLVLEVADAQLPGNARRWRLEAGPDGARCEPTTDAAHVWLGVEELGAAWLGGTTLLSLAAAGRVSEHRAGAVARASRAFRGDVEPVCSHVF
jgi:predicted acetyltransferase